MLLKKYPPLKELIEKKSEQSADHPAYGEKVSNAGGKEEKAGQDKMPVDTSEGGIEILVGEEKTEVEG